MEEVVSLSELFGFLKKRFAMIISFGLIGLIIASVFTFFIAVPQYNATTQILVNRTTNQTEGIQLNDINMNVQMINTYKDIIKGPVILDQVRKGLGTSLTANQLSSKVEIATQDDSQVFSIIVTDEDPFQAANIANEVALTFQDEIGNIMQVENVTVISDAEPSENPISPNSAINLIVGLLVGLLLGLGTALLIEYMDKSIRDEKFILETLGWTNLGNISEMSAEELKAKEEASSRSKELRSVKSRV